MRVLAIILGTFIPSTQAASPYYSLYCNALGTYCGDGRAFLIHLAVRTADVLVIPIIGGLAVIGILWGTQGMISSFGNDEGKENAKKVIFGSVIGIVLAVGGVALVHLICTAVESAVNGSGLCG